MSVRPSRIIARFARVDGTLPPLAGADGENEGDGGGKPDDEHKVPLSQLRDERKKTQAEKQRADDLEKRLGDLEEKDKTELEKAVARADKAERDRDGAKADAESERQGRADDQKRTWLSEAAAAANFHDPGVAVQALTDQLESIDSPDKARKAVDDFAKPRGWMVRPTDPAPRGVEKVLKDGQPVKAGDKQNETPEPESGYETLLAAYSEPAQT